MIPPAPSFHIHGEIARTSFSDASRHPSIGIDREGGDSHIQIHQL